MRYQRLGNTGLLVSEIALGTMLFGEGKERSTPEADAITMVQRFIDAGGNHIDTANVYAGGISEAVVGKAIKGQRDKLVIATKGRFPMGPGVNDAGLSRYHILRAAEDSLRRLDTDVIDLYYMHCWDPLTPLEESLRAYDDLVTQGKVRYIGVSNFKAWQVMKALALSEAQGWARFVAAQYQYSLIVREIEYEYADLLASEGVGLVPWGPLGGGFLSGKYQPGDKPDSGRLATQPDTDEEAWGRRNIERNWATLAAVQRVADARGISVPQVALAWLRGRPNISSVIIGARTLAQFEDNMAAAQIDLTPDEVAALDAASALPQIYPYRFIASYGARQP